MQRDSFIFYKSFYDSIKELAPEEQVQIYNAIFSYQFENKEPNLNGICKSIFTLILPQLEANNKRYLNGCKGGAPKGNQNATKKQPKNNQKTTKKQPNENVNENDNENVNDNDNENVNDNDNENNNKEKYFDNEEINNIFVEFLEVRKKLKAVNSERAIKTLINKLNKYSDDIKFKMIERSVVNSWKDVYELKEEKREEVKLKQVGKGAFQL